MVNRFPFTRFEVATARINFHKHVARCQMLGFSRLNKRDMLPLIAVVVDHIHNLAQDDTVWIGNLFGGGEERAKQVVDIITTTLVVISQTILVLPYL